MHPDDRVAYALGIVKMFRHLWRDTWGMRLQQILLHSILALLDHQGSTFVSLLRLLTDGEYREYVLRSCRNPIVTHFFEKELGLSADTALKVTKAIDARAKIGEEAFQKWIGELGVNDAQWLQM